MDDEFLFGAQDTLRLAKEKGFPFTALMLHGWFDRLPVGKLVDLVKWIRGQTLNDRLLWLELGDQTEHGRRLRMLLDTDWEGL